MSEFVIENKGLSHDSHSRDDVVFACGHRAHNKDVCGQTLMLGVRYAVAQIVRNLRVA
jgi:hypothetical protein